MSNLIEKLVKVQADLKAPKGQFNEFGGYKYRSCEDILEAVKPLLADNGLLLTISDEISVIADRVYVTAICSVTDGKETKEVKAFAREALTKKGMDESQITGAASSYARKYALNGLFLIDDTKDADATNKHGKDNDKMKEIATAVKSKNIQWIKDNWDKSIAECWNSLNDTQRDTLNKMVNSNG